MRREQTNKIRYVLEDILPPALRDSPLFKTAAGAVWGPHIARLADFRARAPFLTEEEYSRLYRDHPRVHAETDNSRACVERIVQDTRGPDICDVGCGTGALLGSILEGRTDIRRAVGVDIIVDGGAAIDGVEYVAAPVENLPFPDESFDTVMCTHVIEHILDYRQAIAELRRIARQQVIIVVPREREYRYTFNPHFNFFPYTHSFLRAVHPVPPKHECVDIQRDIYYREQLSR